MSVLSSLPPAAAAAPRRRPATADGFSLVELMVVVAMMMMVAAIGFPAFSKWRKQNHLLNMVQQTSMILAQARAQALTLGVPVVVRPKFGTPDAIEAFANVDGDPDNAFNPDPTKTYRTVDFAIATLVIPPETDVYLLGPESVGKKKTPTRGPGGGNGGGGGGGKDDSEELGTNSAFRGFSEDADGERVAVFLPNGSVEAVGAIRISDGGTNHFEVAVGRTGKLQVLKHHGSPEWGDDPGFYAKRPWVWYTPDDT